MGYKGKRPKDFTKLSQDDKEFNQNEIIKTMKDLFNL